MSMETIKSQSYLSLNTLADNDINCLLLAACHMQHAAKVLQMLPLPTTLAKAVNALMNSRSTEISKTNFNRFVDVFIIIITRKEENNAEKTQDFATFAVYSYF